jgi:hypothetical protein
VAHAILPAFRRVSRRTASAKGQLGLHSKTMSQNNNNNNNNKPKTQPNKGLEDMTTSNMCLITEVRVHETKLGRIKGNGTYQAFQNFLDPQGVVKYEVIV